ncbi:MAG: hypothetical protein LBD59_05045 [Prevotellaceae bacterium]|nr:hypothetical protein [Prevotellaceae bacterium]
MSLRRIVHRRCRDGARPVSTGTGLCLVRFILAGCACRQSKDAGTACEDRADKVKPCPNNRADKVEPCPNNMAAYCASQCRGAINRAPTPTGLCFFVCRDGARPVSTGTNVSAAGAAH